jgi:uncharacterized membrane protein YfcA
MTVVLARRTQERRRRVLTFLLIAACGSLVGAIFGMSIEIHLMADAALAFYVALLLEVKRRSNERSRKVRPISREAPVAETVSFYEPIQAGSEGR